MNENVVNAKCTTTAAPKAKGANDEEITQTIKQIENSLGELYLAMHYLDNPEENGARMPKIQSLPEELEYEQLDKSLEDLNEDPGRIEPIEDKVTDIPRINRDMLRLSLKMNPNNRPGTPTKYTPSVNSDTDSGIGGVTTPLRRKNEFLWRDPKISYSAGQWPRSPGGSPLLMRNIEPLRNTRSLDTQNGCNSPTLRFNRSFEVHKNGGRYTPIDLRSPDDISLRSLTIPVGSSDGRKIIYKKDAPPESFLKPRDGSFEDGYNSRASFQRSAAGSIDDYRRPMRAQWANKAQFILACVGYSVGLGNIWRFPYVCYKSGGGAFLVPYFLALVICGIPIMYMEITIGQLTKRGPIGALGKLCPILKGAGLCSVVISFIMSTYLSVIIAYSLYYFFSAFKSSQPWKNCDNLWNSPECWMSPVQQSHYNVSKPHISRSPSEEFFENKVLQMTSGIDTMGGLRWELAACLIVAWFMVYFSIWKSVRSSGKVLYITATFPYIIILAFLVQTLTLEGADIGLKYLFTPKWELLADSHIWVNAAGQVFSSMGLAFGTIASFASYNKRSNRILVDTMTVSIINAITSLMVAIFTFATIGNIATEHNTSVDAVLTDGPGLVFVVYPQAMAKMPASQAWAVLFFFMLLCLGLNTQFSIVDVVVTSIQDGFPNWMRRHFICHEVLVFVVCLTSFMIGIINIFQGGIYIFQLVDHYAASISIMYVAFFEVVAVAWSYGMRRLRRNVREMTGERISLYFRFCWCMATPAFILAVWVFSLIDYERPTYRNGEYRYPVWAEALGWCIASFSLICIPAIVIYVYVTSEGKNYKEKLKSAATPHHLGCDLCLDDSCIYCSETIEPKKEMVTLIPDPKLPKIMPAGSASRT